MEKRVLTILHSWKINGNLFNFIKNFLTDRTFNVKIYDKISSTHSIDNGHPQGSVLSVILFLVAINDICKNLGIRLAIGAFRTSPVDRILFYAGEPPLQYRRHSHILKYVTKIKNLTDHITENIIHSPLPTNILPSRITVFENF
jgi:hypothetical protein